MAAEEDAPLAGESPARASDAVAKGNGAEHGPSRPLRKNAAEAPPENAIQASRRRRKPRGAAPAGEREKTAPAATKPVAPSGAKDSDPWTVPQSVRDRFAQDGHRFYFPDGKPAFRDHGRRLTTPSENTQVIRSLIEIAHARGWSEVTLSGTVRFRAEAWQQSRLAGLAVRGYQATDLEQAQLVRALARNLARPAATPDSHSAEPPRVTPETVPAAVPAAGREAPADGRITGRLLDHGRDHYRHDPDEAPSYFVRLQTAAGPREVWGRDLERAVATSLTQPKIGDEVVLQWGGRDPVTVRRAGRSTPGGEITERPVATFRNRWVIETKTFFSERAQAAQLVRDAAIDPREAVRERPELAGTYVALRAAELAARTLRDPQDQSRFVAKVREVLADDIQRGEPLTPVRLRERGRRAAKDIPPLQRSREAPEIVR